ncbi:hypothetical protein [Paractinoplanes deccanensis]|uniref:hypothetical protein n=1 Tax=Paractinoplanes deccanensis TaxID=113561 RepID=UPI001940FDD3|nr:hypothetical protein [Actinoplanes deccanensis]
MKAASGSQQAAESEANGKAASPEAVDKAGSGSQRGAQPEAAGKALSGSQRGAQPEAAGKADGGSQPSAKSGAVDKAEGAVASGRQQKPGAADKAGTKAADAQAKPAAETKPAAAQAKAEKVEQPQDQNATRVVPRQVDADKTAIAAVLPQGGAEPQELPPIAGINRSNRPAWTPMPVVPTYSSSPGITVFGTRLTYRQAAIGFGVVLLIVVLVAVLVAQAFGNDDDNAQAGPGASAAATQQGAAGQGSAKPSTPATGAATPSKAPSTAALPAGWAMRTDATGFKIPLPANAKRSESSSGIEYKWNNRLLLVSQTTSPAPDAYQDWVDQEKDRSGTIRGYQKVRVDRVNGYFKNAADWEYFYTTSTGNAQHVIRRNFVVNDHQAYSLNWYVSPEDWTASQADIKAIIAGFQPK